MDKRNELIRKLVKKGLSDVKISRELPKKGFAAISDSTVRRIRQSLGLASNNPCRNKYGRPKKVVAKKPVVKVELVASRPPLPLIDNRPSEVKTYTAKQRDIDKMLEKYSDKLKPVVCKWGEGKKVYMFGATFVNSGAKGDHVNG